MVSNLFEDVDKLLDGDETLLNCLEQEEEAADLPFVETEASESNNSEAASKALVPTDKAADADTEDASLTTEPNNAEIVAPAQKNQAGQASRPILDYNYGFLFAGGARLYRL